MTKRHRKQGMQIPVSHINLDKKPHTIHGNFHGIDYSVSQDTIDDMKRIHGIDALVEIERMLKKESEHRTKE